MSITQMVFIYGVFICGLAVLVGKVLKMTSSHDPELSCCDRQDLTGSQWTQDGYVKICRSCGHWYYLGDNYGG
jgi:hypothetical protein